MNPIRSFMVFCCMFVALVSVMGSGCSGGSSTGPVSVNTLDGQTDVPTDSMFQYTFSRAVDTSTVTTATAFIVPADEVVTSATTSEETETTYDPDLCDAEQALGATVVCSMQLLDTSCTLLPVDELSPDTDYLICFTTDIEYDNTFVSLLIRSAFANEPFEGFLASFTTISDDVDGSNNGKDFGKPYKIEVKQVSDNTEDVNFGVITDTHIDASDACCSHWRDTDKVKRNRNVIDDIKIDDETSHCLGIVHIGDMIDANVVQNLISFRQHYEHDYPGHDGGAIRGAKDDDYNAYSRGHRINLPVFVGLGNHDVAHSNQGWHYARDYVHDRVAGADRILSYYDDGSHIWRWGKYVFIHLGLWAGSHGWESKDDIDDIKLEWLSDWLEENVGDTGLGVIVFQHYGWDSFSTDGSWWSEEMRQRELNLLCRRNTDEDACNPYNVIGIFTGHDHEQLYLKANAGKDVDGNDVEFDNIVFTDAGYEGGHYGYSIVYLEGSNNKMRIHHKNRGGGGWTWWDKQIHVPD